MRTVRFFVLLFWIGTIFGLAAEEVYHPGEYWGAHPTATWEVLSAEPMLTSFSDKEGRAIFQVFTFPPGLYSSSQAVAEAMIGGLGAEAEVAAFVYTTAETLGALYRGEGIPSTDPVPGADLSATPLGGQTEALFGDLSWSTANLDVRGYGVFISGGQEANSYGVLAFAALDFYDQYHDFLLSNLDSFHPWLVADADYTRAPGPVSQFFADPGILAELNGEISTGRSAFAQTFDYLYDRADATQVVIDREARILSQYQEAPADLQNEAWRRFYQIIYRDAFADLAGKAIDLYADLAPSAPAAVQWPAPILTALQAYDYRRAGTLADLEAPQTAVMAEAGDCDTLVLTYLGVLEHLGIDGIIMVSPRHAHSLAGVGSGVQGARPGANARFTFDDQSWLVAELTQQVDLGLIAASMADPADWFGFDLEFRP